MVDPQRRDYQIRILADGAFAIDLEIDAVAKFGPSLVINAQINVVAHRLQETRPVVLDTGWTIDRNCPVQSRSPGRVQERPEFEHVVGVEVGNEDQTQLFQRQAGIDQTTGDAKATINDDRAPGDLQ